MINEEIINYFSVNCDSRGIPNVKSKDWQSLITTFDKDALDILEIEFLPNKHKNIRISCLKHKSKRLGLRLVFYI